MTWIIVVLAIAVAGAAALAIYMVSLVHRLGDIRSEMDVLVGQARQLDELVGKVRRALPQRS